MTQPDLPDWLTKVTITEDVSVYSAVLPNGNSSPILDVSAFSSLVLTSGSGSGSVAGNIELFWVDAAGNDVTHEQIAMFAIAPAGTLPPLSTPVKFPKVRVVNNTGGAQTLTLWGAIRQMHGTRGFPPYDVQYLDDGGVAKTINTTYTLGAIVGGGRFWLSFISTGTTVGGRLIATAADAGGAVRQLLLTDTVIAHGINSVLTWSGEVIIPQSDTLIQFICSATGTNLVSATFSALQDW